MTIKFNNYSMWINKKHDYDFYDWCVFIDEDINTINSIKLVEYTLHPTFPNPVRIIENRNDCFALYSYGWGTFDLRIKVELNNGSINALKYPLKLEFDDWPKTPAPDVFESDEIRSVYNILIDEKHRWRKIDSIVKNSYLPEEIVLKILDYLKEKKLVRKASYLSIDNKELWGATSIVGITPKPK